MQSACDDLGSRGRPAVEQPAERLALGQVAATGGKALGLLGPASPGGDDLTARQKRTGDRYGLIEQAAGIVAQVEHIARQVLLWDLLGDIADRLLQFVAGRFAERRDPDIADIAAIGAIADGPHVNDFARKG